MEQLNIAFILWATKVYNPNLRGKTAGLQGFLSPTSRADKRTGDTALGGPPLSHCAAKIVSRSRKASVLGPSNEISLDKTCVS